MSVYRIENFEIVDEVSESKISDADFDFLTCDIHLFYLLLYVLVSNSFFDVLLNKMNNENRRMNRDVT